MSALPVVDDDLVADQLASLPARLIVGRARSFGPLRLVDTTQAPVVRAAAEHDRGVLPRWQRGGDGVHEWAEPRHYTRGRTWLRGPTTRRRGERGWGSRSQRVEHYTERPHVNWRTREHWLSSVVPAAVKLRPEALETRRGTVSVGMLLHYCRTVSLHAHARTGRRCIARVDRLAELMEISKSTVQRCQAAAEALGLVVVMSPGRMLTAEETYRARISGSRQRGMANELALVIPQWLPAEAVTNSCDTPTSGRYSKSGNLLKPSSFGPEPRSAGKKAPPPAAPRLRKQARPAARTYDPQALGLARALTTALPWLTGTAPGRLEPVLRRFAGARRPWAARDVVEAIDTANARLSRASMTHGLVRNPPALLAKYLRDLDPDADHPRAWIDVEAFSRPTYSPTQRENMRRLAIHRDSPTGASHPADPETAANALHQMRRQLDQQRRTHTDDNGDC